MKKQEQVEIARLVAKQIRNEETEQNKIIFAAILTYLLFLNFYLILALLLRSFFLAFPQILYKNPSSGGPDLILSEIIFTFILSTATFYYYRKTILS